MGNIEMTCIICLEQMTNYSSKYVYYCEKCYKCFDTICGKNPR